MDIFKKVEKPFLKYRKVHGAGLEFEVRLGKSGKGFFDTNIQKDPWDKIKAGLDAYPHWEDVKKTETTVYSNGPWRILMDNQTSEQVIQKKEKLKHWDFSSKNKPLDVRVSVAQETPYDDPPDDVEMDRMRTRERTSYIRKNLSIDLTKVSGQGEDMDDEEEDHYQVEMEIIDPNSVADDRQLKNILAKIDCVMALLG